MRAAVHANPDPHTNVQFSTVMLGQRSVAGCDNRAPVDIGKLNVRHVGFSS